MGMFRNFCLPARTGYCLFPCGASTHCNASPRITAARASQALRMDRAPPHGLQDTTVALLCYCMPRVRYGRSPEQRFKDRRARNGALFPTPELPSVPARWHVPGSIGYALLLVSAVQVGLQRPDPRISHAMAAPKCREEFGTNRPVEGLSSGCKTPCEHGVPFPSVGEERRYPWHCHGRRELKRDFRALIDQDATRWYTTGEDTRHASSSTSNKGSRGEGGLSGIPAEFLAAAGVGFLPPCRQGHKLRSGEMCGCPGPDVPASPKGSH